MTYLHPHNHSENATAAAATAPLSTTSPSLNRRGSAGIEMTPDCHPPQVEQDVVRIMNDNDAAHNLHAPGTETTAWDAWIQLTKAYIGPGCLSLPWAVSQLGLPVGTLVICVVAVWTSYNCWNVVALKRVIMRETRGTSSQPTYPDVGEWAYNSQFRDLLLVSICIQQLAVCTVFLSFIGENIAAVMERTLVAEGGKPPSHALVITLALPFCMLLSCLPNLKVLSPVMVVATISLFVGFGLLGVVIEKEWDHRPTTTNNWYDIEWSQVPMAVCAILYSYEGICVILPVESAMAQPEQFQTVFCTSMTFTAVVFASVACLCVVAFGDVTNGSVTAFLVENLEDETVKWWLYMANTACSVAVLLTYPLQLFPSFELMGPWMTRVLKLDIGTRQRGGMPIMQQTTFSPVQTCDDDRSSSTSMLTEQSTAADQEANSLSFDAFSTPGDSPQLRAILVCFTYIMAIAVPNVQLLVSLAGALSGSATGLIVPPLLELAYIKRQERAYLITATTTTEEHEDNYSQEGDNSALAATTSFSPQRSYFSLKLKKWECYLLFGAGVVVCVFGTGAALADIVHVYLG